MKKVLLTLFLSFMMITAFSQVQVGFGGAFGTKGGKDASGDKSGFGLHMRLLTEIDDTFGIIAGYNYFPQQNRFDRFGACFQETFESVGPGPVWPGACFRY